MGLGKRRRARLVVDGVNLDGAMLLRPYGWLDGDRDGNAVILFGVNVGAKHVDPFVSIGVELCVAPGSLVFRATAPLYRRRWAR